MESKEILHRKIRNYLDILFPEVKSFTISACSKCRKKNTVTIKYHNDVTIKIPVDGYEDFISRFKEVYFDK